MYNKNWHIINTLDSANANCNCTSIKSKHSVKYLGDTIDQFLEWDIHIANTVTKIRSMFCKFKILGSFLLPYNLRTVFLCTCTISNSYGISA